MDITQTLLRSRALDYLFTIHLFGSTGSHRTQFSGTFQIPVDSFQRNFLVVVR